MCCVSGLAACRFSAGRLGFTCSARAGWLCASFGKVPTLALLPPLARWTLLVPPLLVRLSADPADA
jgi:hypothetical protein